jgi:hypothetical protein
MVDRVVVGIDFIQEIALVDFFPGKSINVTHIPTESGLLRSHSSSDVC